ncbi:MAG: uridine-cytidine kinase [Cyclobacteriaceae bacterium]
MQSRPYFVGITGGSGSGKTYFLTKLMNAFEDSQICLISQDNYYFPIHKQPIDENGIENFDLPESIDNDALLADIQKLKAGETVTSTEYLFNNTAKEAKSIVLKPASIIVVEGIFTFHFAKVREAMDMKLFIDAKDILMLKRRIFRDAEERGYDLQDVLYRYEHHVEPAFSRYIKPYKQEADLIIPNHITKDNGMEVALEVVINHLRSKIGE